MNYTKKVIAGDFLASFVVFLVALPLCMGIALASGVPPILGIMSGVVGGIIVGFFSGTNVQVSGPAAGLAVMVFEIVQKQGLGALAIILCIGGIFQIVSSIIKLGPLFRAISPAVIKGMLAGIGVLIFCSQFHVMLDDLPKASAVVNIITIPAAIMKIFDYSSGAQHVYAACVGGLTIISIVAWNILREKINSKLPAPLIAIVIAILVVYFGDIPVKTVSLPKDIMSSLGSYLIWNQEITWDWNYLFEGIALGFIATTETLLCVTAVDQITGDRSKYNKELFAQGLGNLVAGLMGILPITGVIVRSSANMDAGGKTRLSAIFHGIWLIATLAIFPGILELIPTSALAAILVYTGYKLFNKIEDMKNFFKFEKSELFIYCATVIGIVGINLLYGVIIGFALATIKLLWKLNSIQIEESFEGDTAKISVYGSASFLTIPKLAEKLETLDSKVKHIVLDLSHVTYMDHGIQELVTDWEASHSSDIEVNLSEETSFTKTKRMEKLSSSPSKA